jgi:short-subunit dehydrogenase
MRLAPGTVRLTCVYPGAVATDIVRRGRSSDGRKQALEAEFLARSGALPSRIAERICGAIERDRRRVLVGPSVRILALLRRASPALSDWLIQRARRRLPFV